MKKNKSESDFRALQHASYFVVDRIVAKTVHKTLPGGGGGPGGGWVWGGRGN